MSATAHRKKPVVRKPHEDGPEPVLSLSTAAPVRPTVAIDGKPYEMALMGDFGIVDQQLLSREGAEFQKLWTRDQLNKAQRERLKDLLDRQFAKVLLDVPDEIVGALNDEDRAQVVLSFMLEPLRKAQAELAETQEQAQPISEWVAALAERELSAEEDAELAALIHRAVQEHKKTKS